jgi:hypothetical protein
VYEHVAKLFSATLGTFEVLKWVDWLVGLTHVAALQFAPGTGRGRRLPELPHVRRRDGQNDLLSNIGVFFKDQTDADTFFSSLPTY